MGQANKCGTTSSSIALATGVAIEHNIKVLLLSTSVNDSLIKDSFWKEKKKKMFQLPGFTSVSTIENTGIEGLDRIIRSNKMSPDAITDYTNIVLTGRLEVLMGVEGSEGTYDLLKEKYSKIIAMAKNYYDLVVVDLDKRVGEKTEKEILQMSDIVIATVSQRYKQIEKLTNIIKSGFLNEKTTIITLTKYIENAKYNSKNITRNLLKTKKIVNTIPYNNLFFEATQEGKVIDLFLNLMRLKDADENYEFYNEIKRLYQEVTDRLSVDVYNKNFL